MKSSILILFLVASTTARVVEEFSLENQTAEEDEDSETVEQSTSDISEFEASTEAEQETGLSHWYGGSKIAFSAYLSKANNHLGRGQRVQFDKVLLNDGDGYEPSTGFFRPKTSGVYMFTYVIAQRNHNEIRVNLMYDGKIINGAIAEGMHKLHDAQGTNTAIIHVCKGKSVWVQTVYCGRIQGNNNAHRFTTFSGFLLYARR